MDDYESICKTVGHLYIRMTHQLEQIKQQLSQAVSRVSELEKENEQLKAHISNVSK